MSPSEDFDPMDVSSEDSDYHGQLKPGFAECDFCQIKSKTLWPINDDLWAVCRACMHSIYSDIRDEEE